MEKSMNAVTKLIQLRFPPLCKSGRGCIAAHLLDTITTAHFASDTIQTFNTDTETL